VFLKASLSIWQSGRHPQLKHIMGNLCDFITLKFSRKRDWNA